MRYVPINLIYDVTILVTSFLCTIIIFFITLCYFGENAKGMQNHN